MGIPENVKRLFDEQSLIAFGTADKAGIPNVVPVFWKKIIDENTIILIDNFFKTTKENITQNQNVCISFWDSKTEEAYKIKGKGIHHTEGPIFELGKEFIQSKKPDRIPQGVVEIKVSDIYTIKPGPEAGNKIS